MKNGKSFYNTKHIAYSIFAMLLLAWLTVCLPYVNESQNAAKAAVEKTEKKATADNGNPLTNTNEEKSEGGPATLNEYLHEAHAMDHHFTFVSTFYKCHPSGLYLAYHPDLIIPPPKA
jgi:hypothetical protein